MVFEVKCTWSLTNCIVNLQKEKETKVNIAKNKQIKENPANSDPQGGKQICLTWGISEISKVSMWIVTSKRDNESVGIGKCLRYSGPDGLRGF